METATRKKAAVSPFTKCWNMAKKLDNNQKLELVTMLVDSIKPLYPATEPIKKTSKKKLDANDFAGIWGDDEYMDADELVKTIKNARHFKNRAEFWDKLIEEDCK